MHDSIPYIKPNFCKLLLKTFILQLNTVKNIAITEEKNSEKLKLRGSSVSAKISTDT